MVLVDVGVPEATSEAGELFASTMASMVEMDLDSHDRLIAYILGLSHALNIVFLAALAESGEKARRLADLSSTTFDKQLAVATQVAGENPHLYFEIQSLNEYGGESLSALSEAVEMALMQARQGDEEAVARTFRAAWRANPRRHRDLASGEVHAYGRLGDTARAAGLVPSQ